MTSERPKPSRSPEALDKAREIAIEAARSLHDDKCLDVLVLDVSGLSQVTDFLVIASGTSSRQMASALDHVVELAREHDMPVFGTSTDNDGEWFLADLVDVVVHVFEPNTRAHYDLEMMWGDAEQVPWKRSA